MHPIGSKRLAAAWLAFAVPLIVFLLGWRYVGSGDTEPAELLPISVLAEGDLDFNEFVRGADLPYQYRRVGGHVVSAYPIIPGLLNVPVYSIAKVMGLDLSVRRRELSLLTASIVAALSSLFMFLALQTFAGPTLEALTFALIYSFGTCVWSVASRGMWQHGPSLLFLSWGIWLLMSAKPHRVAFAGFPLALAIANRPTNALLVLPLAVYVIVRYRHLFLRFCVYAAVPVLLLLVYSKAYLGTWLTLGQPFPAHGFDGNVWRGLAGLLFSPSRGLFVFSPVLVVSLLGLAEVARHPRAWPPILPYLAAGVVLLLLVYAGWGMWWGGSSFGYRLLIEVLPALTLLLVPEWRTFIVRKTGFRIAFATLVALSVCANALGAFVYPSEFNENINLETSRLWDARDSELILCARKLLRLPPPAKPSVPTVWWTPVNNDDSVPGWLSENPGVAPVHGALRVSGWAKSAAGDVDVRIVLDDGRIARPERSAFPGLAQVLPQLGDTSRAAFRAEFSPPSTAGQHAIAVKLRSPLGRVRRLGPIRFKWFPD